jgi:hypothetical protein
MMAVVALVVFFVMGGDVSTGHSSSTPVVPASAELTPDPSGVVAPAASFIVITAPDVPEDPKPKLSAGATASPPRGTANRSVPPKASADTSAASTAVVVDAAVPAPRAPPPAPSGAFEDPGF